MWRKWNKGISAAPDVYVPVSEIESSNVTWPWGWREYEGPADVELEELRALNTFQFMEISLLRNHFNDVVGALQRELANQAPKKWWWEAMWDSVPSASKCFCFVKLSLSFGVLVFAFVCSMVVIFTGSAKFSGSIPSYIAFILVCFFFVLLAYLEGLQTALVEVARVNLTPFKRTHPRAVSIAEKVVWTNSLGKFLCGRQLCVYILVFMISNLTSSSVDAAAVGHFSPWFKKVFLDTGFFSALFFASTASIVPQIAASQQPVIFLDLPGMGPIMSFCLFVEALGVTRISDILADRGENQVHL